MNDTDSDADDGKDDPALGEPAEDASALGDTDGVGLAALVAGAVLLAVPDSAESSSPHAARASSVAPSTR